MSVRTKKTIQMVGAVLVTAFAALASGCAPTPPVNPVQPVTSAPPTQGGQM